MLSDKAKSIAPDLVTKLREAGLPDDPRAILGRPYIFYYYEDEDPGDRGAFIGEVAGVQLNDDELVILTHLGELVDPKGDICRLHYLYYYSEDKKWCGDTDSSWWPAGELQLLQSL